MISKEEFIKAFESIFEENVKLNLDTNFKELEEWDSMTALHLITIFDSSYKVELNTEELSNSVTILDLFKLLKSKLG